MDAVIAVAIPLAAIAGIGWVITSFRMFALHRHVERLEHTYEAERIRAQQAHFLELERVQRAQAAEREEFRALLVVRMLQRETASAQMRARQAEVVAELYRRLARVQRMLDSMRGPDQPANHHGPDPAAIVEVSNSFLEYFDEHRIWLDESLCGDVARLERNVRQAWSFFASWTMLDPTLDAARLQQKRPLAWRSAWYTASEEIPRLRARIEAHLRELLATDGSLPDPTAPRPIGPQAGPQPNPLPDSNARLLGGENQGVGGIPPHHPPLDPRLGPGATGSG